SDHLERRIVIDARRGGLRNALSRIASRTQPTGGRRHGENLREKLIERCCRNEAANQHIAVFTHLPLQDLRIQSVSMKFTKGLNSCSHLIPTKPFYHAGRPVAHRSQLHIWESQANPHSSPSYSNDTMETGSRLAYSGVVFLAAFLLFFVEPMAAKQLLPILGGSSAVWVTCLVFFQGALLAGYAYAHWMAQRPRLALHGALLLGAVASLVIPTALGNRLGSMGSAVQW